MKKAIACWVVVFPVLLTSCMKSVDEVGKQNENEQQIQEYMTEKGLTPSKDTLGAYMILRESNPSGKKASTGNRVTMNYQMYTLGGTSIESSKAGEPYSYPFGFSAAPIPGWELGVSWLREGEKATMLLPYYWAFGSGGWSQRQVPGYVPVRLEIEILKIRNENEQIADYIEEKEYVVSETTPENLNIIRLNTVEGDSVGPNMHVEVKYKALLLTGAVLDPGGNYEFVTGVSPNIKGFDQGVRKLRVGEQAVLVFPSEIGYKGGRVNEYGQYTVLPNTPLAFEIELVSAKTP